MAYLVFILHRCMAVSRLSGSLACAYEGVSNCLLLLLLLNNSKVQTKSVHCATGWTVRGSNAGEDKHFFYFPRSPEGLPPIQLVPGFFPGGKTA